MIFSLVLLGCQDYNLQGPNTVETSYNPPDLAVATREDAITQVTVPSVDVLFVIDNSGSMMEEQTNLRQNFDDFMRYFTDSGLDYHVGVVSTDMDDRNQSGKLIDDGSGTRYIDASSSAEDAVSSFRQRAKLGTTGSSTERGTDAAYAALVTHAADVNKGFFRDDGVLSVVVISDEVNQSRNPSWQEFAAWMVAVKPEDDQTWFSSIVGPAPNGCTNGTNIAERGTGYLEVTDQVGGITYSICEDDYSSILEELGMQAAGLKREFFLSDVPVVDTIKVSVDTDGDVREFGTDEWTYDGVRNSITFVSFVPDPLAVVNIDYLPLADSHDPAAVTDTADTGG